MKLKLLPVPTTIKGLKYTSKRFPKSWETVERLEKAIKDRSAIEALALSINLLKYYLSIVIEMYLTQNNASNKKIGKILKEKKDVNDLVNYAIQERILTKDESKRVQDYWQSRSKAIHNFINGAIEYEEVFTKLDGHFQICHLVFSKGFEVSVAPEENDDDKKVSKITLTPKKIERF